MKHNSRWLAVWGAVVLVGGLFGSCASRRTVPDPLADLHNPKLSVSAREKAIAKSWQMAQAGEIDRTAVREDLKIVAWSRHWPLSLRLAALNALFSDADEKGKEDTRNMVRLMLPREVDPQVTRALAAAAARNGWQETTPSLVRSMSVPWPHVPDRNRPEAAALATLNPGITLDQVVYKVFQNPPDDGGTFGLVSPERVRMDAWNLLHRLDADGTLRTRLVAEDTATTGPAEDIRSAMRDLRIMPVTGEELAWLISLRRTKTAADGEWWAATTAAVAALDPARVGKLRLRHLEPIRWASVHRTEWMAAPREQLLADVQTRLTGRTFHRRSAREEGMPKPPLESLEHWRDRLTWGDLLTVLVIDEALKPRDVAAALFAQAAMDRDDKTAEYGGLLRFHATGPSEVVLYPPRPGTRRGDQEFVASTDMFAQSDRALAHYHFHAQDSRGGAYAGPSVGDLAYAARYGRTCLVFTWTSTDTLNVDLYSPEGAVLDLGEISRP